MPKPIVIVGGTSVDTIIHLDQLPSPVAQTVWPRESYRAVGSTGAGKALNLAALGHHTTLHTLIGRDHEGALIRATLNQPGITLLAEETEAPTEQHVNLMDPHGNRISLFTHPSTDPGNVDWHPVDKAIAECSIAVINILDYARPALDIARAHGKPIWTDLHDYNGRNPHHQPFIDAADIIFLSSDNLQDYRPFMEKQIDEGKRLVVCTHGSAGATALNSEGLWLEQPACPVAPVLDTNGAGDAFFSGFLSGYLNGESLRACMRQAAACGALCVGAKTLAAPNLSSATLKAFVNLQFNLTDEPTKLQLRN